VPFAGFDPPESNFWRLPNNWFDLAAHFTSWAEHKVIEYILRHTWGYHEYGIVKLITMDEFMHGRKRRDGSRLDAGCGMAENSIKKGINDAVAHGFLIVQTDDSDRGRIKKYYAPRMRSTHTDDGQHTVTPEHQSLIPQDQSLTPELQALTPGTARLTLRQQDLTLSSQSPDPRTVQTPLETNTEQETRRNKPHSDVVVITQPDMRFLARRQASTTAGTVATNASVPFDQRQQDSKRESAPEPVRADLVGRLVSEGIAPARARSLVAKAPAERIDRQLAWIDRRSCRNRAATLVKAIEEDFSEPVRRGDPPAGSGFDASKFFRGAFALCPRCGSRPCVPECDASAK
jgi:hypothetical protein